MALSCGGTFRGISEDILKLQTYRSQAKEITSSWSQIQVSALLVIPGYKSVWEQLLCLHYVRAQMHLTLCHLMDCSPPGSSVHGILQARILEWVAISSSRGSFQPQDQTHVSCIGKQVLYHHDLEEILPDSKSISSPNSHGCWDIITFNGCCCLPRVSM